MQYTIYCTGLILLIELDEFMSELERRFTKKQQKRPTGIVAKKVRKFGDPSASGPPPDAPTWALRSDQHSPGNSNSCIPCSIHVCTPVSL